MTDILSMLSPEQVEALEGIKEVTLPKPEPQSSACHALGCKGCDGFAYVTTDRGGFRTCVCTHSEQAHQEPPFKAEGNLIVTAGSLDGDVDWDRVRLIEAPVTTINGEEVDLRSEALHDTACADCDHPIQVEVAPKGVDLKVLTSEPRVAVCVPCGQARVRGKRGVLVHDARDFTPTKPTPEEEPVFDLTEFSKAELASLAVEARERMVREQAEALPAKRKKAKKQEAERAAQDEALKRADRAEQGKRKKWMGEFTFNGKVVPALDFTEVDLDESPSSKERSPYNKALHALGEPLLDPEVATYRVLRKLHKRLWKEAASVVEFPKQAQPARLVAEIDPDAKAKIEAFAKVSGKSLAEAREHLTALSLI